MTDPQPAELLAQLAEDVRRAITRCPADFLVPLTEVSARLHELADLATPRRLLHPFELVAGVADELEVLARVCPDQRAGIEALARQLNAVAEALMPPDW